MRVKGAYIDAKKADFCYVIVTIPKFLCNILLVSFWPLIPALLFADTGDWLLVSLTLFP